MRFLRKKCQTAVARRRSAYRPRLELLERRDVPSIVMPDPTFGQNGIVRADENLALIKGGVTGAALEPDGKIVVTGTDAGTTNQPGGFLVARFNTDGSVDAGFGQDGSVLTNFGASSNANAIAVQADGKIIVAGTAGQLYIPNHSQFAVARYNTDGSIDTTFGNGGKVLTAIGNYAQAFAVAIQADGKIVVGGVSSPTSQYTELDFTVARYNANGSLDATFGNHGDVTLNFIPSSADVGNLLDDTVRGLAVEPDGRIVAAGTFRWQTSNGPQGSQDSNAVIVRLHADGTFDTSFNKSGKVLVDDKVETYVNGLALQSDGKVIIAGAKLTRFNADGSLDRSFNGTISVSPRGAFALLNTVAVGSDGMIFTGGTESDTTADRFFLAMLDAQGNVQSTWHSTWPPESGFVPAIGGLVVQPDGKVVLTGSVLLGNGGPTTRQQMVVVRFITTDETSLMAAGADASGGPEVKVYDAATGALKFDFLAYAPGFSGGVRVAVGDVNGDGVPDIITAPGPGGGPDIHVYDGKTGQLIRQFFAFDPDFSGGVYVAAGDVNGDGFADIICGADAGGGPQVQVFSGKDGSVLDSFFAFDPHFTGGVRVAAGDVNGDGTTDIIAAAGPGGGPSVAVFDGAGTLVNSFFAFDVHFTGGVWVSAGDTDSSGKANIIAGAGAGGGPDVSVFRADGTMVNSYLAYNPAFSGGVRVAAVDGGDGKDQIITAAGPGGGPDVQRRDGSTLARVNDFFALDPRFTGGLFVAGNRKRE